MIPINDNTSTDFSSFYNTGITTKNIRTGKNGSRLIYNSSSLFKSPDILPTEDIKSNALPRRYSKSNPTLKEFTVTLKVATKETYSEFISETKVNTTPTTISKVPSRIIELSDKSSTNKSRYISCFLSDIEAEQLKLDPRVLDVEIPFLQKYGPPEFTIPPTQSDTGGFHRRKYSTPAENNSQQLHINWGLIRSTSETNPYTSTYNQPLDPNTTQMIIPSSIEGGADATHSYKYDGTGVDVVICDTGIEADHPEWDDAAGNSRLKQIDWWEEEQWVVRGKIEYAINDIGGEVLMLTINEVISGKTLDNLFGHEDMYIKIPNRVGSENYDKCPLYAAFAHCWKMTTDECTNCTNCLDDSGTVRMKFNIEYMNTVKNSFYKQFSTDLTWIDPRFQSVDGNIRINPDGPFAEDVILQGNSHMLMSTEAKEWLAEERIYTLSIPFLDIIPGFYQDYRGHGTHVASSAVGKVHGHAKNSDLYALGAGLQELEAVLKWHNMKQVDPITGIKRPTVLNCSWHITPMSLFSNYYGLENHDTSGYPLGYNEPTNLTQRCEYSRNNNFTPISAVVIDGVTYDRDNTPEEWLFGTVVRPGGESYVDSDDTNIGPSNPRLLDKIFSAKYGGRRVNVANFSTIDNSYSKFSESPNTGPCMVPDNETFIQIVNIGSTAFTMGLNSEGEIKTWGDPRVQLSNGININLTPPPNLICTRLGQSAGVHTCVLDHNGNVVCWGLNNEGQCNVPSNLGICKDVSVGYFHSCAIKDDNTVVCWGSNWDGQCLGTDILGAPITDPATSGEPVKILGNTLFAKQIDVPSGLYGNRTYAIRTTGFYVVWGNLAEPLPSSDHYFIPIPNPNELGPVKLIKVGSVFVVALLDNGTVRVWGWSPDGTYAPEYTPPIDLLECSDITIIRYGTIMAKQINGTLRVWGRTNYAVHSVPEAAQNPQYISGGRQNFVAISQDGIATMWGWNNWRIYATAFSATPHILSTAINEIFKDLSNAGVHIFLAAGNDSQRITPENGPGWNDHIIFKHKENGGFINDAEYNDTQMTTTLSYFKRKNAPSHPDAIIVGAYNNSSYFKNRAIESISHFSQHGPGVDIYAPGTDIMGALASYSFLNLWNNAPVISNNNLNDGHTYSFSNKTDIEGKRYKQIRMSGTSMASPNMAGIAACILQKFPSLTPKELKNYIVSLSKTGVLYEQNEIDEENGDYWLRIPLPVYEAPFVLEINDFEKYPHGRKFSLGVSDISLVGIAYLNQEIPSYITTIHGWYKYTDRSGYDQYIRLPQLPSTTIANILNKIKTRTASGNDANWSELNDPTGETLNMTGANRLQIYYNEESPITSIFNVSVVKDDNGGRTE